jgi:MoaA/NifB/PqqE/SkfB family radical SAM enzyme
MQFEDINMELLSMSFQTECAGIFDFTRLKGKRIVLFGAGNEGVCAVSILRDNGVEPECFCDNYKEGVQYKTGLPIILANRLMDDYSDAIVIITAIGYKDEILSGLDRLGVNRSRIITDFKAHLYRQPYLMYFELNIVDHCNISCYSCSHFSPIAEERVSPLELVISDLWRMSELTEQNVDEIHILGGEPLLHPNLDKILITAREAFPHSILSLVTNGVLLFKQPNDFWSVCKENDITIEVTKYPINLDYENMIHIVEDKGIKFKFHSYTGKAQKTLYKMPLDLDGAQDLEESFSRCTLANRWIALMDGRMYTCQVAPNVHHFNKKFNENLHLKVRDYLDIYKVKDINEILSFLAVPKPFCKYCKTDDIVNGIPWQPSKKDKSEWT